MEKINNETIDINNEIIDINNEIIDINNQTIDINRKKLLKEFKEFCIKKRLDYKLKTTKLPKYIPLL